MRCEFARLPVVLFCLTVVSPGCGDTPGRCTADTQCGLCERCANGKCAIDAAALNVCGECAPEPQEICADDIDNDCDGVTDEPLCLPPCVAGACNTPPVAYCVDAETLRTFASTGQCVGGGCVYQDNEVPCLLGCNDVSRACSGCSNACSVAGATECSAAARRTCGAQADGCLGWSNAVPCASGFCADATSCGVCDHQCASEGLTLCSSGQLRACQADANGCLAWSAYAACPGGFCASSIACGACTNTCSSAGVTACASGEVRTCVADANGCLTWSAPTACEPWQVCGATGCVTGTPPAVILVNEIVYDSAGTDTDAGNTLFVELWGPPGQPLDGYELVGVNGAGGGDYNSVPLDGSTTGWDGFFLLAHPSGDPSLIALADITSTRVDFQNGPDSVQVRWHGVVVDALGYGTFWAADVFAGEGNAAPLSGAGNSLARDASHSDTGNNSVDFVVATTPSPRANPPTCAGAPCQSGDGCCPAGCTLATDSDCSPACGDGVVSAGETCDPPSSCPTSCSDGNACTIDTMTGSPANCNVACSHQAITQCLGGDGCCPAGCTAATDGDCSISWHKETVDSVGSVGRYSSIVLDGGGRPHISYSDITDGQRGLKYASWDGSQWQLEEVVSGPRGWFTSLALDASGYPHISFVDYATTYQLSYARWNGSGWQNDIVDSAGNVEYTSIALDNGGSPHIAYYINQFISSSRSLRYARWDGSNWQIEDVDKYYGGPSIGKHASLALDGAGHPHISYEDNYLRDLKYAHWDGAAWQIQVVDANGNLTDTYTSLALDGAGRPHIAYTDYWSDLKYAHWNGASWGLETVDFAVTTGLGTSLAVDASGHPHISYVDWNSGDPDLKYARGNGTAWQIQVVDSVGKYYPETSLALDDGGYAHISYHDDGNFDLKYARALP